jgi:signal peptidase I
VIAGEAPRPSTIPALAARAAWLVAAPALLAALALRFLVPEAGTQDWLSRLGEQHPLALAIGLFLLFTALLRAFRDRLPGGRHLEAAADADPPAVAAATWLVTILCAVAVALAVRAVVGQPSRVTGVSMLPTLEPGDYLLTSKLGLRGRAPRRGELVVFRGGAVGERSEELLVKRVIGLPGDRVSTVGGLASINGWRVPFCDAGRYAFFSAGQAIVGRLAVVFLEDQTFLDLHTPEAGAFEGQPVKPGEVFVLGDNRNMSRDSRAWNDGRGAGVPLAALEGRAWRVVGHDRAGHLDLRRLLVRPGLELHLPGIDTTMAQQRIARCLKERPAQTTPPPP